MSKTKFYVVKIGRKPGIYTRWEDAILQTKGYPYGRCKKFKSLEFAQNYFADPLQIEDDTTNSGVGITEKLSFSKKELHAQPSECVQNHYDTMDLNQYKPVMSNIKYTNSNPAQQCSNKQAFECVRQATKHKMTGKDISCLATKKIKVDEEGSYEPTLRITGESIAVFASGEIVDDDEEKRAGIGVYWGPNHPLNVSKRIIGIECLSQAKKFAVVHAIYQAKQSNAKKMTLYCDWQDIQSFARWKAIGSKMKNNLKIEIKEFLTTLELIQKDIDIKFIFIKAENYIKERLPIEEKPSYSYYEGYSGGTCYKKQGIWEANNLARVGCRLCLVAENISEFERVYNRKKCLLDYNQMQKKNLNKLNSKSVMSSKNNVLLPALGKTSSPVLSNKPIAKRHFYYAVYRGHIPGVYSTWADCRKQLINFKNAVYKHFYTEDDAKKFVLTGKVLKNTQIKLPVPKIEVNSDKGFIQQFVQTSQVCKRAQMRLLVPKTEIHKDNNNTRMFVMTGEVHRSSQMSLLVPKEEVKNDNDNTRQLVVVGEVPESSQLELLVPKTEPVNYKDDTENFILAGDVDKSVPVEVILPKTEVNNDKGDTEESSQVELIVPKMEIVDEEFVDVFICGRSFVNDSKRAGIGIYWSPGNALNTSLRLFGEQINTRAEIWAAIHAFHQAKKLNLKNVCAYTDSQFIMKDVISLFEKYKQKNWKIGEGFPVVYQRDFKLLDKAMTGLRIKWCYVKERNICLGFIEAERLAITGCNKLTVESKASTTIRRKK